MELAITAANPMNPRVDRIVEKPGQVMVLTGTPTPGATLANLFGVASEPEGYETKGYVMVPASSGVALSVDVGETVTSELPTCSPADVEAFRTSAQRGALLARFPDLRSAHEAYVCGEIELDDFERIAQARLEEDD